MSIMFLEPVYPEPGQGHRGQLQLVEVGGAGSAPCWAPWFPLLGPVWVFAPVLSRLGACCLLRLQYYS